MTPKEKSDYSEKEAQARFEAALRGGLNTPHKPLKEKDKATATTKRRAKKKKK